MTPAHLHEGRVDGLEPLGLLRQRLDDVPAVEHHLQRRPEVLHGEPLLDDLRHGGELDDPLVHALAEGLRVAVGRHALQVHLGLLQLFNEVGRVGHTQHDLAALAVRREDELERRPLAVDRRELLLDRRLLAGARNHVLHVLLVVEEAAVEQVLQLEHVLGQVELLVADALELLPVAVADVLARQRLQERHDAHHVVDQLPAVRVRRPRPQRPLRELVRLGLEQYHRLAQLLQPLHHVDPQHAAVPLHRLHHLHVQPVQLRQVLDLLLRLLQLGVLGHRKPEHLLALLVPQPLGPLRLEDGAELVELVVGLHRVQALDHGPVALPALAELGNVGYELAHVRDEVELVAALQLRQPVRHVAREPPELLPRVVQVRHLVLLLLVHRDVEAVEQVVHVLDWQNRVVDVGLALADLVEQHHDVAHVVQVELRDLLLVALQLLHRLAHVVHERVQLLLGLVVQVLRELGLPLRSLLPAKRSGGAERV